MSSTEERRDILGVGVLVTRADALVERIDAAIAGKSAFRLAFLNANLCNLAVHDRVLAEHLAGFTVVNDGIGLDIASRLLHGGAFPENLNGTDFTPYFLDRTRHELKLYLLGSRPEVIVRARDVFRARWPRHEIVGARDGFFGLDEDEQVAADIARAKPDLVLVGMGNPRQEDWIARHVPDVCACAFAIGALFDFQAGEVRRAPVWVRRLRCEWMFRLGLEPKRMWRRYVLGNGVFLARVVGRRLASARHG